MVVMQGMRLLARFFAPLSKSRVGMDVALFQDAFGSWVQTFLDISKGDFRNAVDNSGNSVGLVADWFAFACWWKLYPPAAGGSRDCAGNQSGNRPASCLSKRLFSRKGKDAKENL
jgi:hypothetical protein